MRKKKPIPAVFDQVHITRDGNDAIIEYADPTIPETRLTIGPQIKTMTDRDIVGVFNGVMAAQQRLLEDWDRTVTEIPPRQATDRAPQRLRPVGAARRGAALHCRRRRPGRRGHHSHRQRRAVLGRVRKAPPILCRLGMRIAFVPEERVTENPKIVVRDPQKGPRR